MAAPRVCGFQPRNDFRLDVFEALDLRHPRLQLAEGVGKVWSDPYGVALAKHPPTPLLNRLKLLLQFIKPVDRFHGDGRVVERRRAPTATSATPAAPLNCRDQPLLAPASQVAT